MLGEGRYNRGLSSSLNVSQPTITRASDKLGELSLARRKVGPMNHPSGLVYQTQAGEAFLADLRHSMVAADTEHPTVATGAPAMRRPVAQRP